MSGRQWLVFLIPLAYVVGSIPFGLIVGLARGVDPRKAGSGNIGATNVGRLLGGKFFALVFCLDLLKGFLPTFAAGAILGFVAADQLDCLLWIGVAFAAVTGHLFSIFLGFKGGKGVASSAGVMLGVFPYYTFPALIGAVVWIILFKLTRYVSVASMLAALQLPIWYVVIGQARSRPLLGPQWPLLAFSILIPLLIIWKHRGNIARLRAGTENRIGANRIGSQNAFDGKAPGA